MYFEEDEEDPDDDDDVQINFDKVVSTNTTNRELLLCISLQLSKSCTKVKQVV